MRSGLIAKKIGMTSMFDEKGERHCLTVLQIEDCQVVGHRTFEKNGYTALLIGAKNIKPSKLSKSVRPLFTNAKIESKAYLKEFRITNNSFIDVGADLTASHFVVGHFVDATGVAIGKGFAGAMKRHNFRGLEASHGVSISHRSHGSTGGRQDPGKVFKNKKMAGHMGHKRVTVQNLRVVLVDNERKIVMLKGAVPGSKGSCVYLRDAIKKSAVI